MKKLLICVSLLLVLVCAVVACKNNGSNEDTTTTPESVTESGTNKSDDDTSNNLDPTPVTDPETNPVTDSETDTDPVTDPETDPVTTEFSYENYEELGEGKSSPDTYKENGNSLKDGDANVWLEENRPDGISTMSLTSIGFRGWTFIKGVTFTDFGYAFDNDQSTEKWGFTPIDDDALHTPLGTDARRYDIEIKFDGLSKGEHTVYLLAKDADGKVYRIGRWGTVKVKVETYEDLPAIPAMSPDNWYENGKQLCNGSADTWLTDNRPNGVNAYGISNVGVRGWAGGIGENTFIAFGYAFDNNAPVWLEDAVKDAEDPIINAGGATAKRYEFTINVEDIEMGYEGTLYILAKTADGTIYYMNRWVLNISKYQYKVSDAPFHSSVDFVNGKGPDGSNSPYAGRGGTAISGTPVVDKIEGVKAPLADNTLTIKGWLACMSGVEKFVYTVDGVNWFDCTGTLDALNAPILAAAKNVPGLKDATDDDLKTNGLFNDKLVADLSAFVGQTVDVTFAAVPKNATDTVIPFVTIAGVKVSYPEGTRHGLYFDEVSSLEKKFVTVDGKEVGISVNKQLQDEASAGELFLNMTVTTTGAIDMHVKGWAGFDDGKAAALGYSIDGAKIVALENALSEDAGVTGDSAAGANGFRFDFTFPTANLEAGNHTLELIVTLEDGSLISGFTLTYVVK